MKYKPLEKRIAMQKNTRIAIYESILIIIQTDNGKIRKGLTYNRMPSGKFGENAAGVARSADCNHYSQDLIRQ